MPVYKQSYPVNGAPLSTSFRFWPIVRRELQVLLAQRAFRFLLIAAAIPALFSLVEIYSVNRLASEHGTEVSRFLRKLDAIRIDGEFFLDFLKVEMTCAFILILYAGSGLLCDDLRNNLVEVYFSKPLTARDYLVGKILVVTGIGLFVTALPTLLLFLAQVAMTADRRFLASSGFVPLAGLGFSLAMVIPSSLAALACSALTKSRGYAGAALIALLAVDSFMSWSLAELTRKRAIGVFSVPSAIVRVGEALFRIEGDHDVPLGWPPALMVIGAVAVVGLAIVHLRVRRVEASAS